MTDYEITPHGLESDKRQNIRRFTGQIQASSSGIPVGTCFVINRRRGLLITSGHVIRESTEANVSKDALISVYFPQVDNEQRRHFDAHIKNFSYVPGADIVVLSIEDELPLEITQAVLGKADQSVNQNHHFLSFGYRLASHYWGLPVRGVIGDFAPDAEPDEYLNEKIFHLQTPHISKGMGGAPILDWERNLVVGMVTLPPITGEDQSRQADVGLAVDVSALRELLDENDFRGLIVEYSFKNFPSIRPRISDSMEILAGSRMHPSWAEAKYNGAPQIPAGWPQLYGNLINDLKMDYTNPSRHVVGIVGGSGTGKSVLVRQWAETMLANDPGRKRVEGLFWWNFYDYPSVSFFLQAAATYLGGKEAWHAIETSDVDSGNLPAIKSSLNRRAIEFIAHFLYANRLIFVLYGVEQLLTNEENPDRYGVFKYPDASPILDLLDFFTHNECSSFCVITSSIAIIDLLDCATYQEYALEPLDVETGIRLVESIGVKRDEEVLRQLVTSWQGHTLSLGLIAGFIAHGSIDERTPNDVLPAYSTDPERRIPRILDFYQNLLTLKELQFMRFFSIFRMPIPEGGILRVLQDSLAADDELTSIEANLSKFIQRLLDYQLLRRRENGLYFSHPLILAYFRERAKEVGTSQVGKLHIRAARYYDNARKRGPDPSSTVEVMKIEMVYHITQTVEVPDDLSEILKTMTDQAELVGGRYFITGELGRGGFGTVYKAYDVQMQHYVALKSIRPDKLNDDTIRRFGREVQAIRDLVDPHIITLLDFKIDPKEIYLVMRLLTGSNLEHKIDEAKNGERLSVADVVDWVVKIAGALQTAHDAKIIHRDVKPSNIVFAPNNQPYLVDFGLAKKELATNQTDSSVAGTWVYMAPEVKDGLATVNSDQFSLAVVAYEMLTGTYDYRGLSGVGQGLMPPAVKTVLEKALSENPSDRYENIKAFAQAFSKAAIPPPLPTVLPDVETVMPDVDTLIKPLIAPGNELSTQPSPVKATKSVKETLLAHGDPSSTPEPEPPEPPPPGPTSPVFPPTPSLEMAAVSLGTSSTEIPNHPPYGPTSPVFSPIAVPVWRKRLPVIAGVIAIIALGFLTIFGPLRSFLVISVSPTPITSNVVEGSTTPDKRLSTNVPTEAAQVAAVPSTTAESTEIATEKISEPTRPPATWTPQPVPTDTPIVLPSPSSTPSPSPTRTATLTVTPSQTVTQTPTPTLTPTIAVSPTAFNTPVAESLDDLLGQFLDLGSAATFNCEKFNNAYEFLAERVKADDPAFRGGTGLTDQLVFRQIYDDKCKDQHGTIILTARQFFRLGEAVTDFQKQLDSTEN